MTPREGVPVAEAMLPTVEEIRDAHDADMLASYSEGLSLSTAKRLAAKKVRDLVVQHIAAHPAATAREEVWKAMVEALTYIASHRGLTLLGDGSYSDGVRDGWIELADAADRALALARSTGGEHA